MFGCCIRCRPICLVLEYRLAEIWKIIWGLLKRR
jgi:hypothetical protein